MLQRHFAAIFLFVRESLFKQVNLNLILQKGPFNKFNASAKKKICLKGGQWGLRTIYYMFPFEGMGGSRKNYHKFPFFGDGELC